MLEQRKQMITIQSGPSYTGKRALPAWCIGNLAVHWMPCRKSVNISHVNGFGLIYCREDVTFQDAKAAAIALAPLFEDMPAVTLVPDIYWGVKVKQTDEFRAFKATVKPHLLKWRARLEDWNDKGEYEIEVITFK